MLASTIPPWKVEVMERKRSEKLKADQMPTWKLELLKRLQTKAELNKHKIAEEAKKKEEKLILDEHILKVSDNVFVRQELQRKMSGGQIVPHDSRKNDVFVLPGRHIINKDNIVIIEQKEHKEKRKFSNGEVLDVELPIPGIVSKLKGKFAFNSAANKSAGSMSTSAMLNSTAQDRLKSKEIFKTEHTNEPSTVTVSSSVGDFISKNNVPLRKHSFEEKPSRPRLPSLELVAPRGFSGRGSRHGSISETNSRTKPPAKHPDPLLTVATDFTDVAVDVTSSHASDSPKDKRIPCLSADEHSNKDDCLLKGDSSFPSSSVDVYEAKTDDTVDIELAVETLILNSVDTVKSLPARNETNEDNFAPVASSPNDARLPQHQTPPEECPVVPEQAVHQVETSTSVAPPAQPPLPASSDKENIPEIPERRTASRDIAGKDTKLPKTADARYSLSSSKIQNILNLAQTDTCKIIDLGHTSMDPSLLKTKAAIAANEIMKESKTMLIIPKSKGPNRTASSKAGSKVTTKNVGLPKDSSPIDDNVIETPNPKLDKNNRTDISTPNPSESNDAKNSVLIFSGSPRVCASLCSNAAMEEKSENYPPEHMLSSPVQEEKKVPVGIIDSKDSTISEEGKTNKLQHHQNNASSSSLAKSTKNSTKFVVNGSNRSVATNRAPSSNDAVKSLFGSKLGSTAASNASSFGKKSFVIDPRKFKKSSAQAAATPGKAASATKTTSTLGNGNTIVITPKSQSSARNAELVKPEVTSGPKGKRKLTVDQITVIGGYVKLDHSNLSRPNKIRKGNHVKFDASHLESVYQYPSEVSLLLENMNCQSNTRVQKVTNHSSVTNQRQIDKYSPKDLLAMKEALADEDDDDEDSAPASRTSNNQEKIKGANSSDVSLKEESATD